jgi:hypothetical protein|tara:strand:+ start:96 stop:413 length:318 start_codon:yes stop_codon:yes gene_type:complete
LQVTGLITRSAARKSREEEDKESGSQCDATREYTSSYSVRFLDFDCANIPKYNSGYRTGVCGTDDHAVGHRGIAKYQFTFVSERYTIQVRTSLLDYTSLRCDAHT